MKKFILGVCCILLFSGCVGTKRTIKLECKDGNVYYKYYKSDLVTRNENIEQPQFLIREGYYDNDGILLKCVEEQK